MYFVIVFHVLAVLIFERIYLSPYLLSLTIFWMDILLLSCTTARLDLVGSISFEELQKSLVLLCRLLHRFVLIHHHVQVEFLFAFVCPVLKSAVQ